MCHGCTSCQLLTKRVQIATANDERHERHERNQIQARQTILHHRIVCFYAHVHCDAHFETMIAARRVPVGRGCQLRPFIRLPAGIADHHHHQHNKTAEFIAEKPGTASGALVTMQAVIPLLQITATAARVIVSARNKVKQNQASEKHRKATHVSLGVLFSGEHLGCSWHWCCA
jgi:hypothetical protein